jgi:hypothetical protein
LATLLRDALIEQSNNKLERKKGLPFARSNGDSNMMINCLELARWINNRQ